MKQLINVYLLAVCLIVCLLMCRMEATVAPAVEVSPRSGGMHSEAAAWCVAEQIVLAEQAAELHFLDMARHGNCRWVLGSASGGWEGGVDEGGSVTQVEEDNTDDAWKCELTADLPAAEHTLVGSCVKVCVLIKLICYFSELLLTTVINRCVEGSTIGR